MEDGKLLMWDATCSDTFAPSYLASTTCEVGLVATQAEGRKKVKYSNQSQSWYFVPVAIETTGVFGRETAIFIEQLGHHL